MESERAAGGAIRKSAAVVPCAISKPGTQARIKASQLAFSRLRFIACSYSSADDQDF